MFLVFLAFIIVPLIEIAIFVSVGERIGVLWTIVIVVATAVIGTWMLRQQGFAVLARAQAAVAEGRTPLDSVVDGVFLLIAGAFLLTPGLLTDAAGFLLFVAPLRRWIAGMAFKKFMERSNIYVQTHTRGSAAKGSAANPGSPPPHGSAPTADQRRRDRPGPGTNSGGPVIDGEFERMDEDSPDRTRPPNTGEHPRNGRSSPWTPKS